ncbi:hypothetical protein TGMAS_255280 [Toxoplasma gondii MAS]|uniref:Elongation factor Tu GTP binding domain-containing protein n=1 Tax=Toxoplasma gondii MAS TaxID=943118 RepID=A0A086PQV5_TOXGO|nr:hypothetical protein TGMAS_255280 [Toxoplasma gondii MAS]
MTRDLGDFFSGSGAEQEWQPRSGTRTQGRARENQRAASPTSKAPFSGDPPWAETASWRGANRPNDSEEQRRSRKDASTSFVAATRESDRTLMKTQHKLTSDPGVQTPDDTRGTFKSTSEDSAAQLEPFTSPQGEAALPSAVADCHFPSKTPRREPRSKGKWSRNAENEERVRFDASPNEEDVRSLLKQARSSKRQIVYSAENDEGNVEYKLFLSKLTPTKLAHRTTQMRYRLHEGAGVCFYLLGVTDDGLGVGISSRCMRASLQAVELMASSLAASAVVVYLKRVVEEAKGKRDKEEQEEKTERDRDEPQTRRARQFNREVEQSDGKHEKEEAELCETSEEGNVDWETVLERSETNGVRWIACVRVTQNGLTTSTVPSRATAQPAVSPDGLGAQRAGAVRVAVLGAHGAGKSSLVAVLAEEGTLDDGE